LGSARLPRVSDDWIRALPREKSDIFDSIVRHWECAFAMMSVALDEALSMRGRGELICAAQQAELSAVLLDRLTSSLISFCNTLVTRGSYFRGIPGVEPLNPEFFRGATAQTAATWNGILHCVSFGNRPRFIHKLKILSSTIAQLDREFDEAAKQISEAAQPIASWETLESLHYDFNTCLREAEVVLKSFLRALPAERVAAFSADAEHVPAKQFRLQPRFTRLPA
ncbi:MAG: hypothetical protein ACRD3S_11035, partial [Terracidiphilus sp.]